MRASKLARAALSAGLLLYIAFLLDWDQLLNRTVFYVFQTRDLNRASALLQGHAIFFGPEMTGGGNLPGPLYYYLLALPLSIASGWMAAWRWMMVLAVAAGALAWTFLRRKGMALEGLIWLALFATSTQTEHLLTIFINPSYLFVFAVAMIILVCVSVTAESERARVWAFSGGALLCGLAIQIHFQIAFLFFAMLYLNRKMFWRGVVLFLLPSIPYVIWSALQHFHIELGQAAPYSGAPIGSPLTLARLTKEMAQMSAANIVKVILLQSVRVVPWVLPLMAISAWLARSAAPKPESNRLIKPLLVCAAFGFIPFSYIFLVPIANRYGMPLYLSLIFLTAVVFHSQLRERNRIWIYNLMAGLLLAGLLVFLSFPNKAGISFAHIIAAALLTCALGFYWEQKNRARFLAFALTVALAYVQGLAFASREWTLIHSNLATYHQWRRIWSRVYHSTGWTYDEARERLFFVNAHIDEDPGLPYQQLAKEFSYDGESRRGRAAPDGFIVSMNTPAGKNFADYLLAAPIADEIKMALRAGELQLGEPEGGKTTIASYQVNRTDHVPEHFHDIGMAYQSYPEYEILRKVSAPEGTLDLGGGRYLFKWNQCPDHNRYCNVGALVTVRGDGVSVRVIGGPLSQVSPWIHPTWTQAWNDPELEVKCSSGARERFKLADSIGFRREYLYIEPITTYFLGNNGLIAPFERDFKTDCPRVSELSFGFTSTTVDSLRSSHQLPGGRLRLTLAESPGSPPPRY